MKSRWMWVAVLFLALLVRAGEVTKGFDDDSADQALLYETDFSDDAGWSFKSGMIADGKLQHSESGNWATCEYELDQRKALGRCIDLAGKITAVYFRMTSDDANSKDQTIVRLISKENDAYIGCKITYNIKNSLGTANSNTMGFKDTADYSDYVQIRMVLDATEQGDVLWMTLDRYDEGLKAWVNMAENKVPAYTSAEELGGSLIDSVLVMLRSNDPIEDMAITQSK